MSSPLDSRMRAIAREVAEAVAAGGPVQVLEATGPDRLTALEKEVADQRATILRLEARLDAAQTTGGTDPEAKPTGRRTRKTAGTSE